MRRTEESTRCIFIVSFVYRYRSGSMVGYLNVWLWLQFVKVSKNNAKRSGGNILVSHCIHQHYGLSINQHELAMAPTPKAQGRQKYYENATASQCHRPRLLVVKNYLSLIYAESRSVYQHPIVYVVLFTVC